MAVFSTGSVTGRPVDDQGLHRRGGAGVGGCRGEPTHPQPGAVGVHRQQRGGGLGAQQRGARAAGDCAGRSKATRPPSVQLMATCGAAKARRMTACSACSASVRGDFRNLRRAGVAKNRSVTVTRVPGAPAAGVTGATRPPSTVMRCPWGAAAWRETMSSRAAAPMLGRASPRKPSVSMRTSVSSANLLVQWRWTASARSSAPMPCPSSTTTMRSIPPPSKVTAMRAAPASSAFSTSSFTAAAGALDDLPGGDPVDEAFRQETDSHGAEYSRRGGIVGGR